MREPAEEVFTFRVKFLQYRLCLVTEGDAHKFRAASQQVLVWDIFQEVTIDMLPCEVLKVVAATSHKALEDELVTVTLQTWVLAEVEVHHLVTFLNSKIIRCAEELLVE